MEDLFVYSLLYIIGYEMYDEYSETLDRLFLDHLDDEILFDLEERDYKDAMLHLYHMMDKTSIDTEKFYKKLMKKLQPIYEENDIVSFSKIATKLWMLLPIEIDIDDPIYVFSYADDFLMWDDEDYCKKLYESALYSYEDE